MGVGYKAAIEGGILRLKVGYSHDVEIPVPSDVSVAVPNPTKIILLGCDYQRVTQFAAKIRAFRKPEPYNGKGIFVAEEKIVLKEGKKKYSFFAALLF